MATVTAQLSNIRTRFKKDPSERMISDTTLLNFLNEAQDIIQSEIIFPAAQTSATINLVANTQSYSLDSTIIKPMLFRYDANDWVLKEIPFLGLQKRFSSSTGTPQEYAMYGNQVYFHPTPSTTEAAGVTYYFIKKLGELVESGAGAGQVTTSEIPEHYHFLLERGAEMLAFEMIGDFNRAREAELRFKEGMAQAKDKYMAMSSNWNSTLNTIDDLDGERDYNFDPYAS